MDFITAVKVCLGQKYVAFRGRASRSEYWYFVLFNLLINLVAGVIDIAISSQNGFSPAGLIVAIALLLPGLGVLVRRLHDIDRSGWWLLISLIPLLGTILLLVWLCRRGTQGDNRFGSDPLVQSLYAKA
jgi:uncharacterized membrane protein YhaH (DUF805 family)